LFSPRGILVILTRSLDLLHPSRLLPFQTTDMPEIDMQDEHSDFESTSPTDSAPSASYYHTPTLPHSSAGIAKRRKNSKVKMSPILKRAASTPQLNGLSVSESGGLSPSALDKRRNKLGYQRISIACSHCDVERSDACLRKPTTWAAVTTVFV